MIETIWHISDTHTYHDLLQVPEVDMVIHSGDATIPRDKYPNQKEMMNFLDWYGTLMIGYRIFVAGNHDTSIEKGLITKKDFEDRGIIYLENYSETIEGIKIWGSPYTPTFGDGWAFNKSRDKINTIWDHIPEDTDIIVTHGPPKGVLDLSYNYLNKLEFCGDKSLLRACWKINPKLVLFGHIHNCQDVINAGIRQFASNDPNFPSINETVYSNGSVVTDGKFGKLTSNGNIFKI
jgi:Icc-related predicted phosphoesterase